MPITEQMKQTIERKSKKEQKPATALRNPAPKALGTRVGTLQDWREGSSFGTRSRRGLTLRDGR